MGSRALVPSFQYCLSNVVYRKFDAAEQLYCVGGGQNQLKTGPMHCGHGFVVVR